jgi:hypothetical protein
MLQIIADRYCDTKFRGLMLKQLKPAPTHLVASRRQRVRRAKPWCIFRGADEMVMKTG